MVDTGSRSIGVIKIYVHHNIADFAVCVGFKGGRATADLMLSTIFQRPRRIPSHGGSDMPPPGWGMVGIGSNVLTGTFRIEKSKPECCSR